MKQQGGSTAFPLIKTSTNKKIVSKSEVEVVELNGSRFTRYKDITSANASYQEFSPKIKEWLLADNLVLLAGAGTSITLNDKGECIDTTSSKYTGKTISNIWNECKKIIDSNTIKELQTLLNEPDSDFQLERFISKLEMYSAANEFDNRAETKSSVKKAVATKNDIIETIKKECELVLHDTAPHKQFLRTLMSARNSTKPRVQLFTLNYDTLFEQAGEQINATMVDGFSFTRKPIFHGSNFDLDIVKRERHRIHDQENYEEKVLQLFKLHGSLNWEQSGDKKQVIRLQVSSHNPIIIPPSNHKYEQSYQMPFFEMMSRFQQTLRKENTVLIVIGYSFSDLHINRAIQEALESNLNFEIAVVSPTVGDTHSKTEVVELLNKKVDEKKNNNITLISDTFQRFVSAMPSSVLPENQREDDLGQTDAEQDELVREESIDEIIPF